MNKQDRQNIRDELKEISEWPWAFHEGHPEFNTVAVLSKGLVECDDEDRCHSTVIESDLSGWNYKCRFNGDKDFRFIAESPQRISKLLDALEEAEEVIKYYEQRLNTEQKRQTIQN